MVRNSNLNWDEMLGSYNTSYDSNQYSILISWNSRLIANLIFSVFVYYNLAIKHTVYNSVIWSDADVLLLVYFLFFCISGWMKIHPLHLNVGYLCSGFLKKIAARIAQKYAAVLFKQILLS